MKRTSSLKLFQLEDKCFFNVSVEHTIERNRPDTTCLPFGRESVHQHVRHWVPCKYLLALPLQGSRSFSRSISLTIFCDMSDFTCLSVYPFHVFFHQCVSPFSKLSRFSYFVRHAASLHAACCATQSLELFPTPSLPADVVTTPSPLVLFTHMIPPPSCIHPFYSCSNLLYSPHIVRLPW